MPQALQVVLEVPQVLAQDEGPVPDAMQVSKHPTFPQSEVMPQVLAALEGLVFEAIAT